MSVMQRLQESKMKCLYESISLKVYLLLLFLEYNENYRQFYSYSKISHS